MSNMLFLSLKNASGFCGKENEGKQERGGVKGQKKRGKERELSQNQPKGESNCKPITKHQALPPKLLRINLIISLTMWNT